MQFTGGKAGARLKARSQDIGLVVLVTARSVRFGVRHFSVNEKDEASTRPSAGTLNAFILRFAGA